MAYCWRRYRDFVMRLIAKLMGAVWMVVCGLLWLGTGFVDFDMLGDMPPIFANWSVMGLLASGGFGLSFLWIALAIPGYFLWAWGSVDPAVNPAE
jgi:hypothetical protein